MGCDIHMVVQRRAGEAWENVSELPPRACSWCGGKGHYDGRPTEKCYSCKGSGTTTEAYGDRNYTVFSVLANVRNEGNITPIAEPRDTPPDFVDLYRDIDEEQLPEEEGRENHRLWLGDHSQSWVTLTELRAYDWTQVIEDEGWVSRAEFVQWEKDGKSWPNNYCKDIGGTVAHVTNAEMRRRIKEPYAWEKDQEPYTLVRWSVPIKRYCGSFLAFVETLHSLGADDDVRLVFGFDS